jgi:oligopeptide/dipeptide ABC transporter ATP-binding protein
LQEGVSLDIENLDVEYVTRSQKIQAVKSFGLKLRNGESIGLLGESGAGKSTIGWAVLGMINKPNIVTGRIMVDQKNILEMNNLELRTYRWTKASMIFQASMNTLDPVSTVGSSFVDLLKSKKLTANKKAALELIRETLKLVELDSSVIDAYPHQLSGGMKERVAIAMAISTNPTILVADEPTTALDTITQSSILKVIKSLRKESKIRSIIFISHDIAVHALMTDRLIIMFRGRQIEEGPTKEVIANPLHPYTKLLISSIRIGGKKETAVIRSDIPASGEDKSCPYVSFCPYAMKVCFEKFPPTIVTSEGRKVACFLYGGE